MSNIWHDISPSRIQPEDFVAVIEIPKGSKKKYELDKETGLIILTGCSTPPPTTPPTTASFPAPTATTAIRWTCWCSVRRKSTPSPWCAATPSATSPCWTAARTTRRIIAIPFSDPTYNPYHDLMDLPPHLFDEMKHFFSVYKALEGKQAVAKDVNDRAAAVQVIRQAMDHYAECFLGGPSAKVGLYPTEPDQPTAPEGKGK